jgi:hypothetical protein
MNLTKQPNKQTIEIFMRVTKLFNVHDYYCWLTGVKDSKLRTDYLKKIYKKKKKKL